MWHYEIAVVGSDSLMTQLLPVLATRFSRIVWIHDGRLEMPVLPDSVQQLRGHCQFVSEYTLRCQTATGEVTVSANQIVLACGARLQRPGWMLSHPRVVLGDSVHELEGSFQHVTVVGLGATGRQACKQWQQSGITVRGIDARPLTWDETDLNPQGDTRYQFEADQAVIGMQPEGGQLRLFLETGDSFLTDAVVVCCGHLGNTADCNLAAAGLMADDRGRLWCNAAYETWTTDIYAVGQVVGYPRTALPPREQIQILMDSLLTIERVES